MKLESTNLCLYSILGFRETRKSEPPKLILDASKLIGPAEARVGPYVRDRLAGQDFVNRRPIAQHGFFQPIHRIAQMILADFEIQRDFSQGVSIGFRPA